MLNLAAMLLLQEQYPSGETPAFAWPVMILALVVAVVIIAAMWRVYEKAGQPGWAAIIPIYNFIVLLRIAGRPWWWFLLMLIPFVNLVILIIVAIDVARNFGKGPLFGIGIAFLAPIFYPILAWSDATYQPRPA